MKVTIAIPVLNEEQVLKRSVETLRRFANAELSEHEVTIVVADNGSTDGTVRIAGELERSLAGVIHLRLAERGKGLAIRSAWSSYPADVSVFMDVDLSTDLEKLPALIAAAGRSGGLAVGSRYHAGSRVERSRLRRWLSLGYLFFQRLALGTRTADLPCGFKAAARPVVESVMPTVKDNGWFFDSELVVRTERAGLPVTELPVVWREQTEPERRSKVAVFKLIHQYVRSVLGLQSELAAPPPAAGVFPLQKQEWFWMAVLAVIAAAVTAAAPFYALWIAAARGWVWTGLQFLAPGDMSVYLSYIDQVKGGAWLLDNLFTTESLVRVFNPLWLSVGWLARLTGLSAIGAFHLARSLLIVPFVVIVYLFAAAFFRTARTRLFAASLFLFGSGLGIYLVPFLGYQAVDAEGLAWPIDMWVAEANGFLSLSFSPHFIASWTLLLAVMYLLLRALLERRRLLVIAAGLAAAALFLFHPFHAVTLYAVVFGWAIFLARKSGRWRIWWSAAWFVVLSFPGLAYHIYLTRYSEAAAALAAGNYNPTPGLLYVAVGFGLIFFFWPFGYLIGRRQLRDDGRWSMLVIWVLTQTVVSQLPLVFERRLLEGLEFPLVLLAAPAIAAAWSVISSKYTAIRRGAVAVFLVTALLLPSTVTSVMRNLDNYRLNAPPIFFLDPDARDALEWIRSRTAPEAVFLGEQRTAHSIVEFAGRRVYVGHVVNTIHFEDKRREMLDFFSVMDEPARFDFLLSRGIDYVYYGPEERQLGIIEPGRSLVLVAEFGEIEIFRFEPADRSGTASL